MHEDVPTKAIAACFGLAGFVVAIISGMVVGNPVDDTLSRAIAAMFICVVVGYVIGVFTTRAISSNIQAAAQSATEAATEAAETAAKIAQQDFDGVPAQSASKAIPTSSTITTPARATPTPRKAAA